MSAAEKINIPNPEKDYPHLREVTISEAAWQAIGASLQEYKGDTIDHSSYRDLIAEKGIKDTDDKDLTDDQLLATFEQHQYIGTFDLHPVSDQGTAVRFNKPATRNEKQPGTGPGFGHDLDDSATVRFGRERWAEAKTTTEWGKHTIIDGLKIVTGKKRKEAAREKGEAELAKSEREAQKHDWNINVRQTRLRLEDYTDDEVRTPEEREQRNQYLEARARQEALGEQEAERQRLAQEALEAKRIADQEAAAAQHADDQENAERRHRETLDAAQKLHEQSVQATADAIKEAAKVAAAEAARAATEAATQAAVEAARAAVADANPTSGAEVAATEPSVSGDTIYGPYTADPGEIEAEIVDGERADNTRTAGQEQSKPPIKEHMNLVDTVDLIAGKYRTDKPGEMLDKISEEDITAFMVSGDVAAFKAAAESRGHQLRDMDIRAYQLESEKQIPQFARYYRERLQKDGVVEQEPDDEGRYKVRLTADEIAQRRDLYQKAYDEMAAERSRAASADEAAGSKKPAAEAS